VTTETAPGARQESRVATAQQTFVSENKLNDQINRGAQAIYAATLPLCLGETASSRFSNDLKPKTTRADLEISKTAIEGAQKL
jgi:hypothetical protein